jgi:hypothetical protein
LYWNRVLSGERGFFVAHARIEKPMLKKNRLGPALWTAVQDECDLLNSCFADRGA